MRICHVVGARPNFMKAVPVIRAMSAYPVEQILVHTGQHYDFNMSEVFFRQLGMPVPDINLQVGSDTNAQQTAQIMARFEPVLLDTKPDLVVVYGDVNSTLAAALVCSKRMIRIAHVEAGLRSFDRTMPEEINRLLTDQLSDLLFTPSEDGNLNLSREGISPEKVFFVGNVMIDTLVRMLPEANGRLLPDLPGSYALVTLHRPSNVDELDWLAVLLSSLEKASQELPFIFPVHPRTRQKLAELGIKSNTKGLIRFLDPLPYLEFLALQKHATVVITDSGGIQEETTFLGVPCLTVRENTERPITISVGTNTLVGRDISKLIKEIGRTLERPKERRAIPPLWDGHAAERIARVIMREESRLSTAETMLPAELHNSSPWEKTRLGIRSSRAGGDS
ncbi:MAG TPA: UDP-N-acetylglucosamine 2-epimerase (non-hydrolyzing) [Terriglobia bacterium]|jgi:UDP-N-acetylglucosamine 2-epimerase (non-hydrolysing)|nr:UDP-N-acetylglucosamine 2-epimerase (non-hydrolyzing) [Terriglobia bacterium]